MGLTSHLPSELWAKEETFARSIAAKLWEIGRCDLSSPLEHCRTRETICLCQACHKPTRFWNRCDRFYCPMCQQKLSYRRKLKLTWWSRQVTEPKHLVLTVRNRNSISKEYVKYFRTALSRFRRTNLFHNVSGGLISLEVTNEGRGWHLHAHLLLDSGFMDVRTVSQEWARQVGQDFAIVNIKDCRNQTYLKEVTKYAVKGSQLSGWKPSDIADFIDAFDGIRCFSTFGSLFKDQALRSKATQELEANPLTCPHCANYDFWFLDTNEWDSYETTGKLPWQS